MAKGMNTNITVTTTPVLAKVGTDALLGRKYVSVQPKDGDVYFGYDASVSSSNAAGLIFENQIVYIPAETNITIYLVTASGSVGVRLGEVT